MQTSDPYEAGLAALYQRNFPQASAQLAESLRQREEKLAANEKAVADAACFLGRSLRQEGKYRESAKAYQRCLDLRPDDSSVLNRLGISVTEAGDYSAAEPILRSALERREKEFGPDDPDVAVSLGNLMGTLPCDLSLKQGRYYANPANDFWRLIGPALNQNVESLSYDDRLAVLKSNRIGLWDAYHNCVRPRSLDGNITDAELNDFTMLKTVAPRLRLVSATILVKTVWLAKKNAASIAFHSVARGSVR